MSPIQTALALVGLAKQTAKGSPAAQPLTVNGVTGGSPFSVEIEQEAEERTTDASLVAPDANRLSVVPGQDWASRAFPKGVGLDLYGALGAVSTTGTGPYTHAFTPSTDVPYLSAWGKYNGVLHKVQDAKIDELELSWDRTGPLEVARTLIGTILSFPGSITPGTDEQKASYFRAAGGTFKLDVPTSTPVAEPIKAGSIKIANGAEPVILSASVVPDDVSVGHKEITVGLTLVINDLDEWREIVTGTAAGTTVSQTVIFGSFEVTFILSAGVTELKLEAPRVAWKATFPEADPGGGPAELELEGTVVLPSSGAAFTATLINDLASY